MNGGRRLVAVLGVLALLGVATAGAAATAGPTFVDPTATLVGRRSIHLGELVYVAPFARLVAGRPDRAIHVGDESDIQDSVVVESVRGTVRLGEQTILAHGATVRSRTEIGEEGNCPEGEDHCPSFVGFNSEVDGGIVERDAMVLHLARVGPGVRIPSGRKVLSGENVASQSEVMTETAPLTEGDRAFMHGVIEVNVAFAKGYSQLQAEDPTNVLGINYDPGGTAFNPDRDLPTLAGRPTRDPSAPGRIIGDVRMADTARTARKVVRSSLRADEGEPFVVGTIASIGVGTTFHALEHTHMELGAQGAYGPHSLVHGGPALDVTTRSGEHLRLGPSAVLFQSHVGNDVTIGARSLVQASELPDGTVVPPRTVIVGGVVVGTVDW